MALLGKALFLGPEKPMGDAPEDIAHVEIESSLMG